MPLFTLVVCWDILCPMDMYFHLCWVMSIFFFESKQICGGFLLFAYICIAVGNPIIKRFGLTGLILQHFVHVSSQDLDFQYNILWSSLCSIVYTYWLGMRVIALLLSPMYQLLSEAMPRTIVGTEGDNKSAITRISSL